MAEENKELLQLKEFINTTVQQEVGRVTEGLKLDDTQKEQLKNALQKAQEIEAKQSNLETQIDEALKNMKRPGPGGAGQKSFKDELGERLESLKQQAGGQSLLAFKNTRNGIIELQEKAVGDFNAANVSAANITYPFAGVDVIPGVTVRPLYDPHIRPYLRQITTSRTSIVYVQETAKEGGFAVTGMGALKPQFDLDLELKQSNVTKIAGHMRLPEEMIDDIPYLLDYVTTRGVEEYRNAEDDQLLFGDGTGLNLAGLFTVASAFAPGSAFKIQDANYFDVLVGAKTQLRKLGLRASIIFVSPEDWAIMRLTKTTTGEYVFPVIPGTNVITIDGTPIVDNNRIPTGQFLVADAQWAQIADRKGVEVRLFEQDRDNAIRNMVTVVIEGRLALPIYRPQAFVKGSFATAVTAITPA